MFLLKPALLLSIILLPGFVNPKADSPHTTWVITTGSSLKVSGSTNVNKFSCVIPQYVSADTLSCRADQSGILKLTGVISLYVTDFNCHNPVMTKDLRKALKAKDFPQMTINFIGLSRYPNLKEKSGNMKGVVTIELAGVVKRLEVDYKFIPGSNRLLTLTGSRRVNFSDFNVAPPQKLGGAIKARNELNVEFNLRMRALD